MGGQGPNGRPPRGSTTGQRCNPAEPTREAGRRGAGSQDLTGRSDLPSHRVERLEFDGTDPHGHDNKCSHLRTDRDLSAKVALHYLDVLNARTGKPDDGLKHLVFSGRSVDALATCQEEQERTTTHPFVGWRRPRNGPFSAMGAISTHICPAPIILAQCPQAFRTPLARFVNGEDKRCSPMVELVDGEDTLVDRRILDEVNIKTLTIEHLGHALPGHPHNAPTRRRVADQTVPDHQQAIDWEPLPPGLGPSQCKAPSPGPSRRGRTCRLLATKRTRSMVLPLISVPLPLDQSRSVATKRCPR